MQNTENIELWDTLLANPSHIVEVKADVAGVTYYGFDGSETGSGIWELKKDAALFADVPTVGQCVSNKINISFVLREGKIPRMAQIKLYIRLAVYNRDDTLASASDYIPAGTYFVATRETDGDFVHLECYDAMLKAEQKYSELTELENWEKPEQEVAAEIASLMGVELDSRTQLAGYMVPYPQDWTMREVLGYIAAANAGNWVITDENRLRLVKMAGEGASIMAEDHETGILMGDTLIVLSSGADYADAMAARSDVRNVGQNVQSFRDLGKLQPFTGVTVWWSDEDAFTAGDDTGRVLELDCPWATQIMADAIFEDIAGFAWQGAEASRAAVSPAAELGDAVVCDGVLFTLAEYCVSFDGSYLPDIAAPGEDEVDYEYHYESKTTRELERRVKLGSSYYGVKMTRENGIEVELKDANDAVIARAVFNATELSFYAGKKKVLYFDPVNREYKFDGSVSVSEVLESPKIKGNNIVVDGYFGVYEGNTPRGYMGAGHGSADGVPTNGVALSVDTDPSALTGSGYYLIITDSGVRLQAGNTKFHVQQGNNPGAYVNDAKVATEVYVSAYVGGQGYQTRTDVEDILREFHLIT